MCDRDIILRHCGFEPTTTDRAARLHRGLIADHARQPRRVVAAPLFERDQQRVLYQIVGVGCTACMAAGFGTQVTVVG